MDAILPFDQSIIVPFSHWVASNSLLTKLFVTLAVGLVYLVPLILIVVWFAYSRKIALKAAITGLLAWEGLSKLIAAIIHRPRPDFSLIGAKELIFQRSDTSFPSDHSAFLMAVALTFYFTGYKKLGYFIFGLAVLTGICRVGIGVHFPTDILAGWIVGLFTVWLVRSIDRPLDQYLIEPLIKLARKLKL